MKKRITQVVITSYTIDVEDEAEAIDWADYASPSDFEEAYKNGKITYWNDEVLSTTIEDCE